MQALAGSYWTRRISERESDPAVADAQIVRLWLDALRAIERHRGEKQNRPGGNATGSKTTKAWRDFVNWCDTLTKKSNKTIDRYAGQVTELLRTEDGTHFYRCERHGELMLPPDGRVRQVPQ